MRVVLLLILSSFFVSPSFFCGWRPRWAKCRTAKTNKTKQKPAKTTLTASKGRFKTWIPYGYKPLEESRHHIPPANEFQSQFSSKHILHKKSGSSEKHFVESFPYRRVARQLWWTKPARFFCVHWYGKRFFFIFNSCEREACVKYVIWRATIWGREHTTLRAEKAVSTHGFSRRFSERKSPTPITLILVCTVAPYRCYDRYNDSLYINM